MEAFEFFIPQNIMVGAGTMAKLPECAKKLGGSHAMLISGPTLRKMGIVDKAADYLKEAGMKVDMLKRLQRHLKKPEQILSWHLVEDLRWMLPKQLV